MLHTQTVQYQSVIKKCTNDNGFISAGTASPDTEGDGFGMAISQEITQYLILK